MISEKQKSILKEIDGGELKNWRDWKWPPAKWACIRVMAMIPTPRIPMDIRTSMRVKPDWLPFIMLFSFGLIIIINSLV